MSSGFHGGNLRQLARQAQRAPAQLLDFSASINPLGPPPWLRELITAHIDELAHYPDPDCTELISAAARRFDIDADDIVAANGSAELLFILPRALGSKRAVLAAPSYGDYGAAAEAAGLTVETVLLREADGFRLDLDRLEAPLRGGDLVFLGQPNNPTGQMVSVAGLRDLAGRHRDCTFVADEAFIDFVQTPSEAQESLVSRRPSNVVVLRSLTKFYAIPGLRLGLGVADASVVRAVRRMLQPWPVNVLAQAVGAAIFADTSDYAHRTLRRVAEQRERLTSELGQLAGLTVFPAKANFLFVRIEQGGPAAHQLSQRLLGEGISIRVCDDFAGVDDRYFRVAVRNEEENLVLCRAIRRAFEELSL